MQWTESAYAMLGTSTDPFGTKYPSCISSDVDWWGRPGRLIIISSFSTRKQHLLTYEGRWMISEHLSAESVNIEQAFPVFEHRESVSANNIVELHLCAPLNSRIFMHFKNERQKNTRSLCMCSTLAENITKIENARTVSKPATRQRNRSVPLMRPEGM